MRMKLTSDESDLPAGQTAAEREILLPGSEILLTGKVRHDLDGDPLPELLSLDVEPGAGNLDDALRLYLREMGRTPLLTRDQEADVFGRLEDARQRLEEQLSGFGVTPRRYLALARQLIAGRERFDRVVVDPSGRTREEYLAALPQLCADLQGAVAHCSAAYLDYIAHGEPGMVHASGTAFEEAREAVRRTCSHFSFQRHATERFATTVETIRRGVRGWLAAPSQAADHGRSIQARLWMNPQEFRARQAEVQRCLQDARRAKEEVVKANLRLVIFLAKTFRDRGQPLADLIQEGNLGLLKAVDRFEFWRGYRFSTYATYWIRQSITRSIADQSRTIRIPLHLIELISRLLRVRLRMAQELDREITAEDIADEVQLPTGRVQALLRMAQIPVSLESPLSDSDEGRLGDLIADADAADPSEAAASGNLKSTLQTALATLSPRERSVLEARFGLTDGDEHTLEEIARHFKITRERVRQIEAKALRKLRHPSRLRQLRGPGDDGEIA